MRVDPSRQSVGLAIRFNELIERSRARSQAAIKEQIGEFLEIQAHRIAAVRQADNAEWMQRALKADHVSV